MFSPVIVSLVSTLLLIFAVFSVQKIFIAYFLSKYYPEVRYRIDTDRQGIMLTIDDAIYTSESFDRIRRALLKHKLKAVFFVISDYVNADNKHLLIQALKDGHRLENHGKTNQRHSSLSERD